MQVTGRFWSKFSVYSAVTLSSMMISNKVSFIKVNWVQILIGSIIILKFCAPGSEWAPFGCRDTCIYMVYSIFLITKPCTKKFSMRIMTTLQLDTLDQLPPMNLPAETTGGQEYEKQLLDTWQIVNRVQGSNRYFIHLMDFSNLCKSLFFFFFLYQYSHVA